MGIWFRIRNFWYPDIPDIPCGKSVNLEIACLIVIKGSWFIDRKPLCQHKSKHSKAYGSGHKVSV